jgi:hypothetical protein
MARGMVCVKTRKGGRRETEVSELGMDVGCRSCLNPISFPCSVAAYVNWCVIFGIAVSFNPTTRRMSGARGVLGGGDMRFQRSLIELIARASMLEPMVADQRPTRRWGEVQAFQIERVCSRKRGSRRTSASSRTRWRMFGSSATLSPYFRALRRARGVATRIPALTISERLRTRLGCWAVFSPSSEPDASLSSFSSEASGEFGMGIWEGSSSGFSTTSIPFFMRAAFIPVPVANFRASLTICDANSFVGAIIIALGPALLSSVLLSDNSAFITGTKKAIVFPLPVGATASRSTSPPNSFPELFPACTSSSPFFPPNNNGNAAS